MWFPEPISSLDGERHEVLIGDVGHIDEDGGFRRIFNVTVDADHHLNSGGVPDGFEPLRFDSRWNNTREGYLNPGYICSKSVKGRRTEAYAGG